MKYIISYEIKKNGDPYDKYSIFREYCLFGGKFNNDEYYYILKNRGNKVQHLYNVRDNEIKKQLGEPYIYEPEVRKLLDEFIFDSDVLDEVLEELEFRLMAKKYNL